MNVVDRIHGEEIVLKIISKFLKLFDTLITNNEVYNEWTLNITMKKHNTYDYSRGFLWTGFRKKNAQVSEQFAEADLKQ